jgi:hypothetical protein
LSRKPKAKNYRWRHKWKDSIKTDVKETKCEVVDWIHLAQDRKELGSLTNEVKKLGASQKAEVRLPASQELLHSIDLKQTFKQLN